MSNLTMCLYKNFGCVCLLGDNRKSRALDDPKGKNFGCSLFIGQILTKIFCLNFFSKNYKLGARSEAVSFYKIAKKGSRIDR